MDQQTLLYIMTAFVIVAAIALTAQAVAIVALYKGMKATQEKVTALIPKVEGIVPKVETLVETSQAAIEQGKTQILEITGKTVEILDSARAQMARVDELMADATSRAKVQLERAESVFDSTLSRAESVIDDTLTKAQETVGVVHTGVMRPLREIQGVTAGVKTALAFLARGNRPSVAQVTQDEEMFI